MAGLLGDEQVMTYYPAPKTREQAAAWIAWNQDNYARFGHGLWIVETHNGAFVGDCGLTWQKVNGALMLEVGYHVLPRLWDQELASEAAAACRDFARDQLGAKQLVAILHPKNTASRRVAEKTGMRHVADDHGGQIAVRTVLGIDL